MILIPFESVLKENSNYPASNLNLGYEFCAGKMTGGQDSCQAG